MDGTKQHPDGDLLRRIRGGDEEAFVILYRRLQGPIYRFALHMSGNRSLAEDIVQETFMTLIQQTDRFDPERGQVSAFLFGIARNHLMRRFEGDHRMVSFPDNSSDGPALVKSNGNGLGYALPVDLARGETIGHVREAVLSLPEHYREAVVLCDLQEFSYEDAANVLQCAVGTVRSRLHRARALLAIKLREFRQPQPQRKPAVAGHGRR